MEFHSQRLFSLTANVVAAGCLWLLFYQLSFAWPLHSGRGEERLQIADINFLPFLLPEMIFV